MDFAAALPAGLDAFLIFPFPVPPDPLWGVWLGCAILSLYTVVIGEATAALLYWLNRRHYAKTEDEMVRAHNNSVAALHAGDKESYLAINKTAHEHFGKSFFAGAAVGMSSLWPLPFALAWLSLRFEGVDLFSVPFMERPTGYVFVMLALYIPERIVFSRLKKHLPGFRTVEAWKQRAQQARGEMKRFTLR